MKARSLLAIAISLALLLPSCTNFAHGLVANEAKILTAYDAIQTRADEAGGTIGGLVVSGFHVVGRFLLVLAFAGLEGAGHGPIDALRAIRLASCPDCPADAARR